MSDPFARTRLEIGKMELGVYDVDINLDNIVNNQGILLVEFDKYSLDLETTKGINLSHEVLMRIPDNSIWGYFAYDNDSLEEVSKDFLSFFSDFDDENFPAGFYGDFQVDNLGNLILQSNIENHTYVKTFTFRNVFEMSLLRGVIETFRNDYGDEIEIRIYTSNGSIL